MKPSDLLDEPEQDVLAYTTFPKNQWTMVYSNHPIGRLTGEMKRSTNVVGICPDAAPLFRLVDVVQLQQNEEWTVQRGLYITLKMIAP